MIVPLFDIITIAMFIFFCGIPKYMQVRSHSQVVRSHLMTDPPGLTFYESELECLPSCLGMVNAD